MHELILVNSAGMDSFWVLVGNFRRRTNNYWMPVLLFIATEEVITTATGGEIERWRAGLPERQGRAYAELYVQSHPISGAAKTAPTHAAQARIANNPKSNAVPLSILLQGSRTRAKRNVFLLPDGSGSAMSYARMPNLSASPDDTVCLYGLNSPYLVDTNSYVCSIEEIAAVWVREIRRIQPQGPYIIGGWSAGGYYAFEATKHLMSEGLEVSNLVLIDAPCRTDFESFQPGVVRNLARNDLLMIAGAGPGAGETERLLRHFDATFGAVSRYSPTGIVATSSGPPLPRVFVIWASEALMSKEDAVHMGMDLDFKVTRFLLAGKEDLGPNGWEKLVPAENIVIATIPGHHFNIVHPPKVEILGSLLRDVLESDESKWTNEWRRVTKGP